MGDPNLDINNEKPLCDICVVYNMSKLDDGAACFKGENPSSIDVLLSTGQKRFKSSLNITCSLSDFHNLTCVATKLHTPHIAPKTIYSRSYKKFDDEIFLDDVQNIPFWRSDGFDDEDDRLWSFGKLFSDAINENAPIQKKTLKKHSPPYMYNSLRRAIHKKSMLYNSYRKVKVTEIWVRLTSSRKLHIFVNTTMEVPSNISSGGQSNRLLLIKMFSIAIKSFFRKGIKLTPRKFVKYSIPFFFLRRLLIISGLMIPYHPTTIPTKDI